MQNHCEKSEGDALPAPNCVLCIVPKVGITTASDIALERTAPVTGRHSVSHSEDVIDHHLDHITTRQCGEASNRVSCRGIVVRTGNEKNTVEVHVDVLSVGERESLAVVVRATDARTTAARLREVVA